MIVPARPDAPPAVLSLTASGTPMAERIAALTGGVLHAEIAAENIAPLFAAGTPIIGVCAAGILIRLLAPHLADKSAEPPVIAVSQDGKAVVPLLGGHRGANDLARRIAASLGVEAAVTTASDTRFARALDEPPYGWTLSDRKDAKPAMIALLAGAKIALNGHAPWLAEAGYPLSSMGAINVLVTEQILKVDRGLVYHPRTLVAGVGCERGASSAEVIDLVTAALKRQNLSPASLACLATIELKADETALHEAAAHFGVPLRLFSKPELARERYRLVTPSPVVEAEIGIPGVAEAAALKAGLLIVPKFKSKRATCAIGRATRPIDPERFGRPRGVLHIVGIGPGDAMTRTGAAIAALSAATDWVGYGLYLDLLADIRRDQVEHRFDLGAEETRVRHALELAADGAVVALVSSGDAQIYAMASLVFELIEATGDRALSDNARRVAIACHPGISAFQAASAASGALIGHDFCAISLSDLLTPREDILKRLEAAATGDFVTAFYNPRSQRRTDLIEKARDIFRAHRPDATPVIIARSLGRPDEAVSVTTLGEFDPETIDMMTIVLIGSSQSRPLPRGDGRLYAYTPRGYAGKSSQQPADQPPAPIPLPTPAGADALAIEDDAHQ
jgi:cobalt-precorrin 5A hydrolase/precorrin-3B C17-methyltransferase